MFYKQGYDFCDSVVTQFNSNEVRLTQKYFCDHTGHSEG